MKITKTYLKQIIKEELNIILESDQTEEFKPGSKGFKKVIDFLSRKVNAGVGGVANGRIRFNYSAGGKISIPFSVDLNIDNPELEPKAINQHDNKITTNYEDIKKYFSKLFNYQVENSDGSTSNVNPVDMLKAIAWYQNSLHKNKNNNYLKQIGWL